jgi:monolysocardiolipin acyltransferase
MFRKKLKTISERQNAALKNWSPEKRWFTPLIEYSVIYLSQFTMKFLNQTKMNGLENLYYAREKNRPLITFSNHVSIFDDPFITACFGTQIARDRYIGADAQNFFSKKLTGLFFSQGKCIPIVRGAGFNQPGFHYLKEKLQNNQWVHIFPEGGRTRAPGSGLKMPFTQGLAYLILHSKPLILPFIHSGMEKILPVGGRFPRIGKKATVTFGKTFDSRDNTFSSFYKLFNQQEQDAKRQAMQLVTDWSQNTLSELQQTMGNHSSDSGISS